MIRKFFRGLALPVGLGFLFCLFLRHAFSHDKSFALYKDNEDLLGPLLSTMSATLRHGAWPLRTDTFLGGIPLYDLPQLSAFYPFYFEWLPLFRTPFDSMYSMHWMVLLHILIAEINMCILLRVFAVSRFAAVFGAALFAFSANYFVYSSWMNIVAPYAWLPLYLAGISGILNGEAERRYFLMALGGMVLLVFASPAQPLIHAVFLTIVFILGKLINNRLTRQGVTRIFRPIGRLVVIGGLSFLIVSPAILPVIWNLNGMIRWIGDFPAVIGNAPIPFEAFRQDQLTAAQLGGVLFKMKGLAVGQQFFGLIPLALAVAAVAWRPRFWFVQVMTFVAVYSIISAAGTNLGLGYVNYYVPILNKIREPSRFLILFQLSMAALSAVGLDELARRASGATGTAKLKTALLPFIAVIVLSIIAYAVTRHEVTSRLSPVVSIAFLCVLAAITCFVLVFPGKMRALCLAASWAGVAVILHAVEVRWIPFTIPESQYLMTNASPLDQALARVAVLDPARDYRVIFEGKIDKQQAAMLASYRGIRTLNAYINPAPYRQFSEMYHHSPRSDSYFFALGAKYMICIGCSPEAIRGYRPIEEVDHYQIYEADNVLPHSYLQTSVDGYYGTTDQFKDETRNRDFRNGALFLKDGVRLPLASHSDHGLKCYNVEKARTINYERFDTSCQSPGVLVLNEFFDSDWTAYLDGSRTEVLEVNGNQLGVMLPAGAHFVEFKYSPRIFKISIILMAVGIGFSCLWWFWCAKNGQRKL
ncbi:hypothetical protein VOI32_05665 [Paraburkholderia caribensis]|uniref:YfhO family protein n=1 Tax=Paraburkholderia caribensis TaxID=75105 RepID=A0ABV0DSC7_9BURK|nr:hypothetical protein [Paraburkholderia caribensis]MCO4876539.1 hypothetical protein [Paraburkholderia caribensis]